jgi:hypothetical protein
MPKTIQEWTWEEAFQKFGFGDGNETIHTDDIVSLLASMGWGYNYADSSHNQYIFMLEKGGAVIEFDGYDDEAAIRAKLPMKLVEALDKEFPAE